MTQSSEFTATVRESKTKNVLVQHRLTIPSTIPVKTGKKYRFIISEVEEQQNTTEVLEHANE